jgi:DNA-binding protein HU-beta
MAAKKPGAQATVTLKHLAENLSESHEMSKKQTEALLGELVDLVTKHLKKGDRIRIGGLGILVVRKRAARRGRNPATGELRIKASKKGAFSPKPSGEHPQVIGTTSDGVKILRPVTRPKHFTSKEIRETIRDVKRAASG